MGRISGHRKEWREFKSKFPEFEKQRLYKADLGPELDKFAKAATAVADAQKTVLARLLALNTEFGKVIAILETYKKQAPIAAKAEFKEYYKEWVDEAADFKADLKEWQELVHGVQIVDI